MDTHKTLKSSLTYELTLIKKFKEIKTFKDLTKRYDKYLLFLFRFCVNVNRNVFIRNVLQECMLNKRNLRTFIQMKKPTLLC